MLLPLLNSSKVCKLFEGTYFSRLSVEKDWLVTLCGDNTTLLARLNANVRSIDLCCNLAAPMFAGQLLHFCSYAVSAIILSCWVLMSASLELLLLQRLYKANPVLQNKQVLEKSGFKHSLEGWKTFFQHPVRYDDVLKRQ